jgi:hypothetical protein
MAGFIRDLDETGLPDAFFVVGAGGAHSQNGFGNGTPDSSSREIEKISLIQQNP